MGRNEMENLKKERDEEKEKVKRIITVVILAFLYIWITVSLLDAHNDLAVMLGVGLVLFGLYLVYRYGLEVLNALGVDILGSSSSDQQEEKEE